MRCKWIYCRCCRVSGDWDCSFSDRHVDFHITKKCENKKMVHYCYMNFLVMVDVLYLSFCSLATCEGEWKTIFIINRFSDRGKRKSQPFIWDARHGTKHETVFFSYTRPLFHSDYCTLNYIKRLNFIDSL